MRWQDKGSVDLPHGKVAQDHLRDDETWEKSAGGCPQRSREEKARSIGDW